MARPITFNWTCLYDLSLNYNRLETWQHLTLLDTCAEQNKTNVTHLRINK